MIVTRRLDAAAGDPTEEVHRYDEDPSRACEIDEFAEAILSDGKSRRVPRRMLRRRWNLLLDLLRRSCLEGTMETRRRAADMND